MSDPTRDADGVPPVIGSPSLTMPGGASDILTRVPRSRTVSFLGGMGILSGALGMLRGVTLVAIHVTAPELLGLAGALVAVVTSWNLRKRREWARQSFIAVLGMGVGVLALQLIFPRLLLGPNVAFGPPRSAIMVQLAVLGLINGAFIAKLSSKRVRAEFKEADD